jgi:CheY-like chemotaxis protein
MSKDDKIVEQIRSEFKDEARERYGTLQIDYSNLRSMTDPDKETVRTVMQDAEKALHCARSAEAMTLYLALKRLTAFLEVDTGRIPGHYADIDTIFDILDQIFDGEIDDDTDEAEFLRSLPTPQPTDSPSFEAAEIEVLLVDPQRTSTRLIANQVQGLGYSVISTQDVFEALKLAVSTKPDMIIASVMQKDLSGVSLARALKAVPETEGIPVAVITSFARNNKALDGLPESVALVDKGKNFQNGLLSAMARFQLRHAH